MDTLSDFFSGEMIHQLQPPTARSRRHFTWLGHVECERAPKIDFDRRACRNNKLRRRSASNQLAGSHRTWILRPSAWMLSKSPIPLGPGSGTTCLCPRRLYSSCPYPCPWRPCPCPFSPYPYPWCYRFSPFSYLSVPCAFPSPACAWPSPP